jgi:tetratricopeptide (TPR) repeat protein
MAPAQKEITEPGNPPFFQNPKAEKLIVFIHGVGGDPRDTWTNKDNDPNFFWPEELSKDPAFKNADVLSFGYKSECGPTLIISEIAKSLELTLNSLTEMENYKSLEFIAHSMGGLVTREFLLSRHKHLIKVVPVTSVITLSTPNLGSGLGKFASYFCKTIQLKDLKPGRGEYLDLLNERWRERFEQNDSERTFSISAGYEIVPVNKLVGRIVEKDSAVYFAQQTQPFLKDHLEIAKPKNTDDDPYVWVRQELLKKAHDSRIHQYTDEEVQRLETIIDQMQKELAGTDLEKALQLISRGEIKQARALLQKNKKELDEKILEIAKIEFATAQTYDLELDYKNALEYYETAARLAHENSLYQNDAGFMANTLGQYNKAIEYFENALACDLKSVGPEHPKVAIRWNNLGAAWKAKGKYDKAIKYFKKALASDLKTFGPEHQNVANRWNNLGATWHAKGRNDQAIGYYEKALESDLKTFGPAHPDVATLWNNLGEAWKAKGKYDQAIEYYEKALASDLKTFGPEHPNVANRWNNLGTAWHVKGDYDQAIGYYEKALASDLKTFGPEHPNVANRWNSLGGAWHAKEDYDQAIGYYEKALASDLISLGPEHPQIATYWNNLGGAWGAKGKYGKAIEFLEKALANDLKTFSPEHPDVARDWNNLGTTWGYKGNYDKTIECFQKALEIVKKMGLPHRVALIEENIKEAQRRKNEQ